MRRDFARLGGFNLIEFAIVLACSALLASIILLAVTRKNATYSKMISCLNNLKSVGISFRSWTLAGNEFPMQVHTMQGGTMELVQSGQAWVHFQVMSNELGTPRFLVCPNEPAGAKIMANTFSSQPQGGSQQVVFGSDKNVSYFVGVNARNDINPQAILTGDRGMVVNGAPANPGLLAISTNDTVAWYQPRHQNCGNICLADGSVQTVSSPGLTSAFRASGLATNRLAMP